jgi:hypothetical protein
MRTRRGGFWFKKTVKFGNAQERIKLLNKTLDELILKHLTKDELKTLCRMWNINFTGSPEYDSKALLKVFHGYPNFAKNTLSIVALHVVSYASVASLAGIALAGGVAGTLLGLSNSLLRWRRTDKSIYTKDRTEATAALLNRVIDRIVEQNVKS